jgi:hypothetical protein
VLARLVATCSVLLVVACSDGPADPGQLYGPCLDNPYCGGPMQLMRVSVNNDDSSDCICVNRCNHDDECPVPTAATARATCPTGDLIVDGYAGVCELSCTADGECPEGMTCLNTVCRAPGPPVPSR